MHARCPEITIAFHRNWGRVRLGLQTLFLGLEVHLGAAFVLLLCVWTESKNGSQGLTDLVMDLIHQSLVVLKDTVLYPVSATLMAIGIFLCAQVPRQAGARFWQWALIGSFAWPLLFLAAFVPVTFFPPGLLPAPIPLPGPLFHVLYGALVSLCLCGICSRAAGFFGNRRLARRFIFFWCASWGGTLGVVGLIGTDLTATGFPELEEYLLVAVYGILTAASVLHLPLLVRLLSLLPASPPSAPLHPEAE